MASVVPAGESRVLAVRVDFPYEDPDHETTSGRGTFDLRDYHAPDADALRAHYLHPWDIPPHDRTYFEYHLQALNNYWSTVSEGRVTVSGDVWPRDPERAYTMSQKFYKYGNGRRKEQTAEKLVGLLTEALAACKAAEGAAVDFSRYDTFMVIHAGIGSETSGMLNDIPSAFVDSLDIFTQHGGPLVIGGVEIKNGMIVPEMVATNGAGGLNGIMAQMFGHYLGLPSLSDTDDGMPAAGGWALMDTGAMAWGARTRGFVPTHPMIWSKIELGWIEPVIVTADTIIDIAATHIDRGIPRAVKIPITADEYLLLENRYTSAPRDSLASAVLSDADTAGVWLAADNYDAYIPGSGILAWHINDAIIRARRTDNTINDDIYRRGIDLLEADGRQDIGAPIGFGDPRGEYAEGHADDTYKSTGRSMLSPITTPDSGSMWSADSGVIVTVKSPPGEVMTVQIDFEGRMPSFPAADPVRMVTAADLTGDGADELIVSHGDSAATVYAANGTVLANLVSAAHPVVSRDPVTGDLILVTTDTSGWVAYAVTSVAQSVRMTAPHDAATPVSLHGYLSASSVADSGVFTVYDSGGQSFIESFTAGAPPAIFALPLGRTVQPDGIAANGHIALIAAGIRLYEADFVTDRVTERVLPASCLGAPVVVDLDRDGSHETVVPVSGGLAIIDIEGGITLLPLPAEPTGSPAAADIDGDGYPEVVVAAGKRLYAFTREGTPLAGFPFDLPPGMADERITSPPIIADLDGDNRLDIAVATSAMRLVAFDPRGDPTPGFPITLRSAVASAPCAFVREGGVLGIAYATVEDMYARAFGVNVSSGELPWSMAGGGPGLSGMLETGDIMNPVRTSAPFSAYCYPNPVTGRAATFRIVPSGPTDCTIQLYTADGIRVFERRIAAAEIEPGVPNEVRIDATRLASGLYLAVVRTRQHERIFKVGVLK